MCIFGGLSNKSIGREMVCKFKLMELEMEVSTPEDLGDRWGQAVLSVTCHRAVPHGGLLLWTLLDSHLQPRQLFWSFSRFSRAKDDNAPQNVGSKHMPTAVL